MRRAPVRVAAGATAPHKRTPRRQRRAGMAPPRCATESVETDKETSEGRSDGSKLAFDPMVDEAPKKLKVAHLATRRVDRVKLPAEALGGPGGDASRSLPAFLASDEGAECVLNLRAMKSAEKLPDGVRTDEDADGDVGLGGYTDRGAVWRAHVRKLQLLNITAEPVIDIRVVRGDSRCRVEMLSAQLEGSGVIEKQNEHLKARMANEVLWGEGARGLQAEFEAQHESGTEGDEEAGTVYMYGVTDLAIDLDIYTLPFTLLPAKTVESPGNALVRALIGRMLPAFLNNVVRDWEEWAGLRADDGANGAEPRAGDWDDESWSDMWKD